jgi:ADP-ribosylglycohydrolase
VTDVNENKIEEQMSTVTLHDKMRGSIGGTFLGSAMGVAVEHHPWPLIEEKHGFLTDFVPWTVPFPGWENFLFVAGTTEDGVERQKLMIAAIAKKGGRVNADDVKASWVENMNRLAPGTVSMHFEGDLLRIAESGIPGADIGRYCDYAGLNSFARACHPIGLINAGDIETAKRDILEVGQLYQTSNSRGLKWACVTGVAIAAATTPGATCESVIAAIFDHCDPDEVLAELEPHLKATSHMSDVRELRRYFDDHYSTRGVTFSMAYANEVVTKGIAIFQMTRGVTRDAIIAGTNIGRDTDCIAAVAGGIAGALTGTASIPQEWFDTVDAATRVHRFSSSQRRVLDYADDVYRAFRERLEREGAHADLMVDA